MVSSLVVTLFCLLVFSGIIGWLIGIFNTLVRQKNQINNALAQIDVQLKRRHDLIPNLVEAAKGYMTHEKTTLQAVIDARNHASQLQAQNPILDNQTLAQIAQAETALSSALGRFYMVAESYPELKADGVIKDLFDEITNTENRISFARQHYNDSVMFYNNNREIFPNNFISSMFQFHTINSLEFADKSQIAQSPKITLHS